MKILTSNLAGAGLDWATAKCEGLGPGYMKNIDLRYNVSGKVSCMLVPINREYVLWNPSTNWKQGGPIIEREKINTKFWRSEQSWIADIKGGFNEQYGPTPLIAAMRCYVARKLGEEVDVPDELT